MPKTVDIDLSASDIRLLLKALDKADSYSEAADQMYNRLTVAYLELTGKKLHFR